MAFKRSGVRLPLAPPAPLVTCAAGRPPAQLHLKRTRGSADRLAELSAKGKSRGAAMTAAARQGAKASVAAADILLCDDRLKPSSRFHA
jgi:hypothetical protein